jgi:hypothetical protein
MYIKHSVHIQQPVKACTEALLEGPAKWFPRLGANSVSTVGLHVAKVPVRKRVVIELGEPVKTATWMVIPVNWKATFPEKLFPTMTGKIELAPVDVGETRVTVSGMFQPPLGKLGEQLHASVMHGVAQGTVRELAESIAKRIEETIQRNLSGEAPVRKHRMQAADLASLMTSGRVGD